MTAPGSFADNFTGTNGDAWDSALWVEYDDGGNGLAQIDTNRGEVDGGAAGRYYIAATQSAANFDITFQVEFDGAQTDWGFFFRSVDRENQWRLNLRTTSADVRLEKYDDTGVPDPIATEGVTGFDWTDTIWCRIRATNGSIRVKAWQSTDSEPSAWGIDVTDSFNATKETFGFYVENTSASIFVDSLAAETYTPSGYSYPVPKYIPLDVEEPAAWGATAHNRIRSWTQHRLYRPGFRWIANDWHTPANVGAFTSGNAEEIPWGSAWLWDGDGFNILQGFEVDEADQTRLRVQQGAEGVYLVKFYIYGTPKVAPSETISTIGLRFLVHESSGDELYKYTTLRNELQATDWDRPNCGGMVHFPEGSYIQLYSVTEEDYTYHGHGVDATWLRALPTQYL